MEAGAPVPELCRVHGISSATFDKWRAKFGGMDVSLMTLMKELEEESRRLKKLYVDAQLAVDDEDVVYRTAGKREAGGWSFRAL